jgi:hypothetical protein
VRYVENADNFRMDVQSKEIEGVFAYDGREPCVVRVGAEVDRARSF